MSHALMDRELVDLPRSQGGENPSVQYGGVWLLPQVVPSGRAPGSAFRSLLLLPCLSRVVAALRLLI